MTLNRHSPLNRDDDNAGVMEGKATAALNKILKIRKTTIELSEKTLNSNLNSHLIFLDLYRFTTFYWIEYSKLVKSSNFIYGLIERFFSYYEEYVSNYFLREQDILVGHWEKYFLQAEKFSDSNRLIDGSSMLYCAAYAHTRYDLAEAIFDVFALDDGFDPSSERVREIEQDLLGVASSGVFSKARHRFIKDGDSACRGLLAFPTAHIADIGSNLFEPFWLRRFQSWRRQAWQEAMECLSNSTRPSRPKVPLISFAT